MKCTITVWGKVMAAPHDFSHGVCKRCGVLEPKEVKKQDKRRGKYSGLSSRPFGMYEAE